MSSSELDESGQQFLIQLFEQTRGEPSAQVSMYDVGKDIGMDRDTSSRVAEILIGLQLVEIRTLSGGIGISAEGADEVKSLMGGTARTDELFRRLTDQPVMDQINSQAVEQIAAELKSKAGNLGLDFEGLSELMADLKTIDAQLSSSRPKTAIIRECLHSLQQILGDSADAECLAKVNVLLGSADR